jgi:hypothetical protein
MAHNFTLLGKCCTGLFKIIYSYQYEWFKFLQDAGSSIVFLLVCGVWRLAYPKVKIIPCREH